MSDNRLVTRPKNAGQHPGLLIPKQARRSSEEVAAERKAKEAAKKEKERTKKAGIKRVAAFEKNQADNDAMEQTPKVVTKPKPLVRTRSYADVLRGDDSDVGMADGQSAKPDSEFQTADVEDGQTTESDGMETAVEELAPPRKKMKINQDTGRKGKAPRVRDAIKAVQDTPKKNHGHKKTAESSNSELVDVTPKPSKNSRMRAPSTEPEDDRPAAPPKRIRLRVAQPATTDEEGDEEDLPSKTKGMKNKGKGKEKPASKSKATNNRADQIRGRNVPKSVTISHLIRIYHSSVTCLY